MPRNIWHRTLSGWSRRVGAGNLLNLLVSYDQEFDVLYVNTGEGCFDGASITELFDVAAEIKTKGGYDVAGLIIMDAAAYLSPWFTPIHREPPAVVAGSPLSRYDRATDTLTWGITTDDPGMITQDNEHLIAYWQTDPEDADYFPLIGVSLLNAAQHLAPFFVRVEPAGGGG